MDRLKKFFTNGILMTAVALIIRYVSVNFNVYISNRIGAVSMGIFTLVSSVYGFAITVATSGVSLATTKLVSEALGFGASKSGYDTDTTIRSIMKKSILLSLSVSSATSVILFISSGYIGTHILGDERTVSSLQILAFSLPAIAVSSSLSGYFIAMRRVHKNALVQVLSQGLRIYLCILFLGRAVTKDMESACVAIVIGMTLSEIIAFLIHAALYLVEQRNLDIDTRSNTDVTLTKRLIPITVPVAFSAYMRSALVTVEHLLIPRGLEKSGASRDLSLAAYGTIHSVVFPLVLFPSAISSAFAGLLVPEISESDAACDKARIDRIVSRVLKTVLIYSIGVAGVIMCLASELGSVMFPSSDTAVYIAYIAPLIPIMYLDTSVDSILKGLGYQLYSMIVNIADAGMSVILVWIMLPRFGIMGYIATVYFTEIVNATLSITKLLIVTKTRVRISDWLIKPIIAIIISTAAISFIPTIVGRADSGAGLFFHIALISMLYLCILVILGAISPSKIKRSVVNFFNTRKEPV